LPRTVMPPPMSPHAPSAPPAPTKSGGVPVWVWVAGAVVATVIVLGVIGSVIPQQQIATNMPPIQQPVMNQPPAQQPTGDQNPQQIIIAQLHQAQANLGQQGYQMVGQPFSGGLQPGEAWNIPAEMHVGYEYQIVGVCDRDCSDLDLRLFDGNGGLIIEDTSVNSQPNVGVIPTTTGAFTIQVHMYACSVAPCYYAIALYGRPRQ
jgi:hypothetical protein